MMMTNEQQAEHVWEKTLVQVKKSRKNRLRMKIGVATGAICGWAIVWLLNHPAVVPIETRLAVMAPVQVPSSNIAVMRMGDYGVIRLEECSPDELGAIELQFNLDPVVSNDWESRFP